MIFLNDTKTISTEVKQSLLNGTNMLSSGKTRFVSQQVEKVNFGTDLNWFKARNWTKLCQDEYLDSLPIGVGKTGFIQYQAGFIKGYLPTDFPVMKVGFNNDNIVSEALAYSLVLLMNGDISNAYSTFQVWLYMMNRFEYVEKQLVNLDAVIPEQTIEINF